MKDMSEFPAESIRVPSTQEAEAQANRERRERRAVLEAILYVTEDPLTIEQLALGLEWPKAEVEELLAALEAEHQRPERGVEVRAVAGGYRIATKPEHHEAVRLFVKFLKPPLKLSLPALETLAVIAYKQPITLPEIQEIRGVHAAGVIRTLLDRKLITTAGRKAVVGRPILYKTTREFLLQFGLNELNELPTLKEFEELSRAALGEAEAAAAPAAGPERMAQD
ncbi:MAG: SMC-Scp complex subunit ScpB [Acidobacteria bacterium]|nr:SMC-Scp complex subunit ScpB [Acidobacteriota bacterium]